MTRDPSLALASRNDWLQVIRAAAAVGVFLFHLVPLTAIGQTNTLVLRASQFGLFGVDVFFVLSGYVVTATATSVSGLPDATAFFLRRLVRVFVGYWLVLIPVLLLLALGLPAMTAQPQVVTSFFLLEWRLELNVIPVAWSLTFELWFYLCIATLYVSCRRSSTRLLGVLCASLALNLWHGAWAYLATDTWLRDQLPVPFFLSGLALEFLWGALLASALNHFGQTTLSSHRLRAASLACLLVFAGFVAVLALPVERYAVSSLRAWSAGLVGLGLVMLALCANAKDATTCAFVLRAPTPLVALGDASYSLYLLHPVALWLLPFFVGVRAGADAAFSAPVSLLVFAVVCAVSILWYFWLERPAIRAARSLVESKLSWR